MIVHRCSQSKPSVLFETTTSSSPTTFELTINPTYRLVMLIRRFCSLQKRYQEKVIKGDIVFDVKQVKLLKLFERLADYLRSDKANCIADHRSPRLRGIYLYGGVGTGKTMLMNMFYDYCSTIKKKNVHFHEFMLDVHQRLHQRRKLLLETVGKQRHITLDHLKDEDPFVYVAKEISIESTVLCFDEFQVTDVCDALIMRRLFDSLWKEGVILVATSNRAPTELYQNGLNRKYFLPFIERLQKECIVRHLDSENDYRLSKAGGSEESFFIDSQKATCQPSTDLTVDANTSLASSSALNVKYQQSLEGPAEDWVSIPIRMGRILRVQSARREQRVCYTTFTSLCGVETGAADFSALCLHFDTIYLDHIPVFPLSSTTSMHNEARRFVTFIDEAYRANIRLIWSAEKPPLELFQLLPDPALASENEAEEPRLWHGSGPNETYGRSFEMRNLLSPASFLLSSPFFLLSQSQCQSMRPTRIIVRWESWLRFGTCSSLVAELHRGW